MRRKCSGCLGGTFLWKTLLWLLLFLCLFLLSALHLVEGKARGRVRVVYNMCKCVSMGSLLQEKNAAGIPGCRAQVQRPFLGIHPPKLYGNDPGTSPRLSDDLQGFRAVIN